LNFVFDFGGVVFTWEPEVIIANNFTEPEIQDLVRTEIFSHIDWLELDRGTLPLQEAILRAADRTGLTVSTVTELMHKMPLTLVPIPETIELLYRLKAQGHKLYYLSNMHVAAIEHLERTYSFWDVFEGGIISCRVHLIKPELPIYTTLLETYGLNGSETVFIDDTEVNLTAAAQVGIQTIHFENPSQCVEQMKAIDIML